MKLLERIEARKRAAAGGDAWSRYSELLRLGDDAPDATADELGQLMETLNLTGDQVRAHASVLSNVEQLSGLAGQRDALKAADMKAREALAALCERHKRLEEQMKAEQQQATAEMLDVAAKASSAADAVHLVDRYRDEFHFLFEGEPALASLSLGGINCPDRVDEKLLTIDRRGVFDADTLVGSYGMPSAKLGQIPRLPDGQTFLGSAVRAWARRVRAELDRRERERFAEELAGLPTVNRAKLASIDRDRRYREKDLLEVSRALHERVRMRPRELPRTNDDGFSGADLLDLVEQLDRRREFLKKRLAETDPPVEASHVPAAAAAESPESAPIATAVSPGPASTGAVEPAAPAPAAAVASNVPAAAREPRATPPPQRKAGRTPARGR